MGECESQSNSKEVFDINILNNNYFKVIRSYQHNDALLTTLQEKRLLGLFETNTKIDVNEAFPRRKMQQQPQRMLGGRNI
jgi:hypothetical protein